MTDRPALTQFLQYTRRLSTPVRYLVTLLVTLAFFALPDWLVPGTPTHTFSHLLMAVLLAAAMFDHGTGMLATTLGAGLSAWFRFDPRGSFAVAEPDDVIALSLFVAVGVVMTVVIESLHRSVARLQELHDVLHRSERARALLMREFRHRTRNDLGSLVGLLILRARLAPSAAAREALQDAADHAMALSRVHARLALDEGLDQGAERPVVDSRDFVTGLCADIQTAGTSGGLRPVRLAAEAESHLLSAERAVPLGLVLNETVTNALKYAFPEDRAGTIDVRFTRQGEEFVLVVADDGIGLPPEGELEGAPPAPASRDAGLGTRLLRALAAQLRGRFARHAGPDGRGTVAELRFQAAEAGGAAP